MSVQSSPSSVFSLPAPPLHESLIEPGLVSLTDISMGGALEQLLIHSCLHQKEQLCGELGSAGDLGDGVKVSSTTCFWPTRVTREGREDEKGQAGSRQWKEGSVHCCYYGQVWHPMQPLLSPQMKWGRSDWPNLHTPSSAWDRGRGVGRAGCPTLVCLGCLLCLAPQCPLLLPGL